MNRMSLVAVLTLTGALAATMTPGEARACGGFFCDNSRRVNQSGERIVFARAADGSVTAVIEIEYFGPAERFAWMLPVEGTPSIAVSSSTALSSLSDATEPRYVLRTTVEGTCRREASRSDGGAIDAGAGPRSDGGAPTPPPSVSVVDGGAVGPYDYVIISVDPTASDPSGDALLWLSLNGYDVDPFGRDRLAPYLDAGMNILAFRLTKGNDTGSIRPVMIGFGAGLPTIPIRPTAVAASDDMGVLVWVLGQHRAVPVNYMSLELNEALVNWLSPIDTYDALVTRAANEAGGQGFVTELAGPAAPFAESIFPASQSEAWASIRDGDWSGRHGALLDQVARQYRGFDGIRDAFGATVPLPDGFTLDALLACLSCTYPADRALIEGFDPAAFLAAVQEQVITPIEATRALFEAIPYVTRLYTTMSADEMTRDPVFDENPDLGDVSNEHHAERVIECAPDLLQSEAPWRVALADGNTVRGVGTSWPLTPSDDLPASAVIRRVGTEGAGEVVEDHRDAIRTALERLNAGLPIHSPVAGAGGCSVRPGPAAGTAFVSAFALALVLARRRRRA